MPMGKEGMSRYYQNNKDRYRDKNYKRTYGISLEEYNDLLLGQNDCCALCGRHKSFQKRPLSVDHCHETGVVRGLLCLGCNAGLGMLGDNIEGLERAISYLKGELS